MSTIPEGIKRTQSVRGDGAVIDAVRGLLATPAGETPPATPPATPAVETPPATPQTPEATEITAPADGKGSDFLSQLEAALSGESPDTQDDGNRESGEVPLSLAKVAEAAGISESDLFALPISMPDGAETRTLGQLKDAQTELNRTRGEVESFFTERETQRTEMATARGEIETLIGMIPTEMRTPEMLQHARERLATLAQSEARKLVERVPEWASAETRAADMAVIGDHVGKWGFNTAELASISDHRMLAYVRHNALQEQRLNTLLGKSKAKPAGNGKPQRGKGEGDNARTVTTRAANAMQHGNRSQQAQALGDLIRSKGVTL